ncbi:MAG: hypothetical protein ACR2OM_14320, partial [Aestuariivirgaceae bacterium]
GRLRPSHYVEAGLWLLAAAVLFGLTFKFNQEIEIYKFGASAWPRGLIVMTVLAVIGQLFWQYRFGDRTAEVGGADANIDEEGDSENSGLQWYAHTALLIALPFFYMRVPDLFGLPVDQQGTIKLVTGAVVVAVFAWFARTNRVGGMIGLPLMFAAFLEDFGFYAMAPCFMVAVMWLMGERRLKPMLAVSALLFAILLLLFVKVLYVGLPTGNIEPFYSFGNWVVKMLQ